MGTSTNGILVFGIDLGEERPEFLEDFDDFDDFDDFLNDLSGLPKWGEEGHSFSNLRAFREAFGVSMTRHCSYEYPMWILSVRGTEKTAYRGYPKEITIDELQVSQGSILRLRDFCEEYGIEWKEPKWYLCSLWG